MSYVFIYILYLILHFQFSIFHLLLFFYVGLLQAVTLLLVQAEQEQRE